MYIYIYWVDVSEGGAACYAACDDGSVTKWLPAADVATLGESAERSQAKQVAWRDAKSCWDSRAHRCRSLVQRVLLKGIVRCCFSLSLALPLQSESLVVWVRHTCREKAEVTADAIKTWVTEDGLVILEGWRIKMRPPPQLPNDAVRTSKQTMEPLPQEKSNIRQHPDQIHLSALLIKPKKRQFWALALCDVTEDSCTCYGKTCNHIIIILWYPNTKMLQPNSVFLNVKKRKYQKKKKPCCRSMMQPNMQHWSEMMHQNMHGDRLITSLLIKTQ